MDEYFSNWKEQHFSISLEAYNFQHPTVFQTPCFPSAFKTCCSIPTSFDHVFLHPKMGVSPNINPPKQEKDRKGIVHWVILLLFIMAAGDQKSAPLRVLAAKWRVSSIGTRQSPLLLSNTSFLDASVSPLSPPSCVTIIYNMLKKINKKKFMIMCLDSGSGDQLACTLIINHNFLF